MGERNLEKEGGGGMINNKGFLPLWDFLVDGKKWSLYHKLVGDLIAQTLYHELTERFNSSDFVSWTYREI